MTATITPARPVPAWLTPSPGLRFDLATTRAILAAIVARAERRPMPYLRSLSLGDLFEDARQAT